MTKFFLIDLTLYNKPFGQVIYPNRKRPIKIDGKKIDVINHNQLVAYIERVYPSLKGKPYRVKSMNLI